MRHYKKIGDLFKYPSVSLLTNAAEVKRLIELKYRDELENYDSFLLFVQSQSITSLQEYYINTFDVQALCHIDVGYTLFGEDLKRGDFLVKLQDEYKKYNLGLGDELPDHLPNVLNLLSISTHADFNMELVQYILLPAILSMIKGFKSETNVYLTLLKILKEILITDFDIQEINIELPENKECVFAGNGCSANNLVNY